MALPEKHLFQEQVLSRLQRRVPLNIIKIKDTFTHDLAVISSIRTGSPLDLHRYTNCLLRAFGGQDMRTQVIFADNTAGNTHLHELLEMKANLENACIEFASVHAPEPGKIHGLNACLQKVEAPYVLSVDTNKIPYQDTLMGLYKRIKQTDIDLISARAGHGLTKIQNWCAGLAYIGRRWCFPGFPEVISDDGYTHSLTLARGGSFTVAHDLPVSNEKGYNLTRIQRAERSARQRAGRYQINGLTVVDENGQEWPLRDSEEKIRQIELNNREKLAWLFSRIKTMSKEELKRFPIAVLAKLMTLNDHVSDDKIFYNYLEKLIENPTLCAWTV